MKFKVGDKVRIVCPGNFFGHTATITGVNEEDGCYFIDMDGGILRWYDKEVEECSMNFKVGDRVMVGGLAGVISDIDTEDDTYIVGNYWYDEEQLIAAPSKVADLLGVDDDTPFNIVDSEGSPYQSAPYVVHDGKLVDCDGDECGVFAELLNGEAKVVPLGDEWYEGRPLYYVDSCGKVDDIPYRRRYDLCVALMLLGNAFTTKEGAKSAAEHINADIIEKMGEC